MHYKPPAEQEFDELAAAASVKVYKNGWPDRWFIWNGGMVAVEIKNGWNDQVRVEQCRMHETLRHSGIPTFIWTPEDAPPWKLDIEAFRKEPLDTDSYLAGWRDGFASK